LVALALPPPKPGLEFGAKLDNVSQGGLGCSGSGAAVLAVFPEVPFSPVAATSLRRREVAWLALASAANQQAVYTPPDDDEAANRGGLYLGPAIAIALALATAAGSIFAAQRSASLAMLSNPVRALGSVDRRAMREYR
jgi:hypothetical protein